MTKNKTVIIAPAIKTHFWQDLHDKLSKGKMPFHLVFVGHVEPDFELPDNFTHINCSLPPAHCVEVAYRYTYKHIKDAEYIVNISDDLHISEDFVEELIGFYKDQEVKFETDFLLVGPTCLQASGEENLMATHEGGPSLLAPAFTTIENSKKIGGVDKRFHGIYWDCDRALRTHEMGGKVVFASCQELTPVCEIEHTFGLYAKYKNIDRTLLDEIWTYGEGDDPIVCAVLDKKDEEYEKTYGRKRNNLVVKPMSVKRKVSFKEHPEKDLEKYHG